MLTKYLLRWFVVFLLPACCSLAQVADGNLQIHHIDMGQGDAAVLISPMGKVVLFDAGLDVAKVKNCDAEIDYLDQVGVKQIDYIFVSHYHEDHIGCIPAVLKRFPLKGVSYDRGQQYDRAFYRSYIAALGPGQRKTVTLGQIVTLDGGANPVMIKVLSLNGQTSGGNVPTKNENDLSVSTLVSFGEFREEIGGDLSGENTSDYQDIETEEAPSVGSIDVYKVHHHCSQYSSNTAWLNTTLPTVEIISTGNHNDYKHPAEECLTRLREAEISRVYWTEEGAGGRPSINDVVVNGDISIEVAPNAKTYTVSYGNGTADTYSIKAAVSPLGTPTSAIGSPRKYAWSAKSDFYQLMGCPATKRITHDNLRTGDSPPPDKKPSACVIAATP